MAAPTSNVHSLHYDTAGQVISTQVIITGFTWTGSTAADDSLTFKNGDGSIVFGPYTSGIIGNVINVIFPKPIAILGLEVDVLSAGVVEVYLA